MVALDSAICISHINDMSNWSNLPSIVDRVTQSGVYRWFCANKYNTYVQTVELQPLSIGL